MSTNSWRQRFVAVIAPVMAAAISIGNTAAFAGHRSDCPCRLAPSQSCNCPSECDPSAPTVQPSVPSDAVIDPALTQPSVDSGFSSSFDDTDFSTGLATNFGGGGATDAAYAAPGYIDPAKIQNRIRVRYDNMQNANKPARAGFLYPQIDNPGVLSGGRGPQGLGGGAAGSSIDIEQVSIYAERAFRDRFSLFIDVPIRWVSPLSFGAGSPFNNGTQHGAGDIKTGFRWGWIDSPDEHLTLQTRFSLPTGEARKAVGTGNTTIDVSLLYDQRLSSKFRVYAELNDWQTLDAVTLTDVAGGVFPPKLLNQNANILRFGLGLGYGLLDCSTRYQTRKLTLLFETVTWTVLDGVTVGIDANNPTIEDAVGDTIVNGKYGVRYTQGSNSIYVGYGHNWTSERWYSDLLRVSWMHNF